jgi:hypothetical protein
MGVLYLWVRHLGRGTFAPVSLAAAVANFLILPAQSYVMIFGGIALLLGLAVRPLGQAVGWIAWVFLTYTVQTSSGRQVLVDGGPSARVLLSQLGRQMPFWDRSLDVVLLTPPDSGHITGLVEALERYWVDTEVFRQLEVESATYGYWLRLLETEGATVFRGEVGLRLALGEQIGLGGVVQAFQGLAQPPQRRGQAAARFPGGAHGPELFGNQLTLQRLASVQQQEAEQVLRLLRRELEWSLITEDA